MEKKKIYKCSTRRRELCVNMTHFASDQYSSGRRLFVGKSHNFKTHRAGVRVWYQFGSKMKEFVSTQFCPWCGGRVGWYEPKEKKA